MRLKYRLTGIIVSPKRRELGCLCRDVGVQAMSGTIELRREMEWGDAYLQGRTQIAYKRSGRRQWSMHNTHLNCSLTSLLS